MSFWTVGFLIANLFLVAVVIALPLGIRTVRQDRVVKASIDAVWQALYPLGGNVGFDGDIVSVRASGVNKAWISYSWRGRDDKPIERLAVFGDVREGEHFTMHIGDDTSLDASFWKDFRETVDLRSIDDGRTKVTVQQRDSYRGAAFLIFRYFALRRRLDKLVGWAETGKVPSGGLVFEHPLSQVGFAVLSTLLIWPLFGLTVAGLSAAVLLTAVIALHELGHVIAFRVVGHRSARMIFLPLIGGIAIGGRPYDKKFEVAFVALMGPGFSAFLVALSMFLAWLAAVQDKAGLSSVAMLVGGFIALFNLANLLPVWRFDGAQILRQLTEQWQWRVFAELLLLLPFMVVALALGSPLEATLGFTAATIGIAVLTRNAVFKPRQPLNPMSGYQAIAACSGLAAVISIHAMGVVWAAHGLFKL